MNRFIVIPFAAVLLAACAGNSNVKITHNGPAAVQTKSRSEPVFYNGRTYRLDYEFVESDTAFDMRVSGMGPKQQKDAVAVATSALGYFACPEGQKGHLDGQPGYAAGVWKLQARCG